jgi:hypothetical protein
MAKAGATMPKFAANISMATIRTAMGGATISKCDDHMASSRIAISNSYDKVSEFPRLGPSRQVSASLGGDFAKNAPFCIR